MTHVLISTETLTIIVLVLLGSLMLELTNVSLVIQTVLLATMLPAVHHVMLEDLEF